MSNALPLSLSNRPVPPAPTSRSRASLLPLGEGPKHRPANAMIDGGLRPATIPPPASAAVPRTVPPPSMAGRMIAARDRIRAAAEAGIRMRAYEVALDLDMSEFHFARQFRAAFGRSPHAYYDEIRAERARAMLGSGLAEGDVARKVGLRRPAELRALLKKCFDAAAE